MCLITTYFDSILLRILKKIKFFWKLKKHAVTLYPGNE